MKRLILAAAASILFAPAAHTQCAGCGADFNKAERERMKKEADEQRLRDSIGNGMAGQAADAQKADQKNVEKQTDEALKDDQPPPKSDPK